MCVCVCVCVCVTRPFWSHVLALSAWTLKKAHTVSRKSRLQISAYKAISSPSEFFTPKPYMTV